MSVAPVLTHIDGSSMNDQEIREWLGMLGRTPHSRYKAVSDLLDNAATDKMTSEDRATCLRALEILGPKAAVAPPDYGGGKFTTSTPLLDPEPLTPEDLDWEGV